MFCNNGITLMLTKSISIAYSWTALFVFGFFLKNVLRIFAFAERHAVCISIP